MTRASDQGRDPETGLLGPTVEHRPAMASDGHDGTSAARRPHAASDGRAGRPMGRPMDTTASVNGRDLNGVDRSGVRRQRSRSARHGNWAHPRRRLLPRSDARSSAKRSRVDAPRRARPISQRPRRGRPCPNRLSIASDCASTDETYGPSAHSPSARNYTRSPSPTSSSHSQPKQQAQANHSSSYARRRTKPRRSAHAATSATAFGRPRSNRSADQGGHPRNPVDRTDEDCNSLCMHC
jgi:hypothetical protein